MVVSIRQVTTLLSLFFILHGCRSLFPLANKGNQDFKFIKKKNYCDKVFSSQRITESPVIGKKFENLVGKLPRLRPSEQFVLLAMLQMYYSPEVASPSADFLFFSSRAQKWEYFSFDRQSTKTKYPLLYGLNFLLKKYRSRHDLGSLARLITRHLSFSPGLSEVSARFVRSRQKQFQGDKNFQFFYHRSGDLLRFQESLRFKNFAPWVKKQLRFFKRSPFDANSAKKLYTYQPYVQKNISIQCNVDMNTYRSQPPPVAEKELPSIQFMLKEGEHIFVGLFSQRPNSEKMIPRTPFFDRVPEVKTSSVLCITHGPDRPPIVLTSGNDRDPAQHIHHLLERRPHAKQTPASFARLLSSARHLFLDNPHRLLYESERGAQEQLEKLFALNFPVYHSVQLGKVMAVNHFAEKTYLFGDDRHAMEVTCR